MMVCGQSDELSLPALIELFAHVTVVGRDDYSLSDRSFVTV